MGGIGGGLIEKWVRRREVCKQASHPQKKTDLSAVAIETTDEAPAWLQVVGAVGWGWVNVLAIERPSGLYSRLRVDREHWIGGRGRVEVGTACHGMRRG